MARHKHPKQLSEADIERLLADAEKLHKTITRPLISPSCDHHRALVALNQALLQTVKEVRQGCSFHQMERDRAGAILRRCLVGFPEVLQRGVAQVLFAA